MKSSEAISIIAMLVGLLIITNYKSIYLYREWLHFKIKTKLKQYINGRKDKTD